MQASITDITKKIQPFAKLVKKYLAFILLIVFLGLYVFLVQYIGGLIQDEPSQAAIDGKLKPVNRLNIDKAAIEQITQLDSQNIEVKGLFDQARQNPFTE